MTFQHISVAIPLLAEHENLPSLMERLCRQTCQDFSLYLCVNNPEGWETSSNAQERAMFADNQASLEYLQALDFSAMGFNDIQSIRIIDRSSRGHGWTGKQRGVGWARKVLFDAICDEHDDNELIVSLDADTTFADNYLEALLDFYNSKSIAEIAKSSALAVPYYHPLTGEESIDRAMLRYDIYMRHYLAEMQWVSDELASEYSSDSSSPAFRAFPYAFTALGSAMVFTLGAYRRVGGITPLQGGEDFYLMQKFAKTGLVLTPHNIRPWTGEPTLRGNTVFPSSRPSLRVPFGTGPAIAKGLAVMDGSYPLYPHEGFAAVLDTYRAFPRLYDKDEETPMSAFLREQLKSSDLWGPLRCNFKSLPLFVHACAERVDGLRILQFLKQFRTAMPCQLSAEETLGLFCISHDIALPPDFSFAKSPINEINTLRDRLFELTIDNNKRPVFLTLH